MALRTEYTPYARYKASRLTSMQLQVLAHAVEAMTRQYGSQLDLESIEASERQISDIGIRYSWDSNQRAFSVLDVEVADRHKMTR